MLEPFQESINYAAENPAVTGAVIGLAVFGTELYAAFRGSTEAENETRDSQISDLPELRERRDELAEGIYVDSSLATFKNCVLNPYRFGKLGEYDETIRRLEMEAVDEDPEDFYEYRQIRTELERGEREVPEELLEDKED